MGLRDEKTTLEQPMKLTPAMRAAARAFGKMGGRAATNQREAGKASQTPEVKARRAATLAAKRNGKLRKTTETQKH